MPGPATSRAQSALVRVTITPCDELKRQESPAGSSQRGRWRYVGLIGGKRFVGAATKLTIATVSILATPDQSPLSEIRNDFDQQQSSRTRHSDLPIDGFIPRLPGCRLPDVGSRSNSYLDLCRHIRRKPAAKRPSQVPASEAEGEPDLPWAQPGRQHPPPSVSKAVMRGGSI